MNFLAYHLVLVLGLLLQKTLTQTAESSWVVPAGSEPDFTETFRNGDILAVAWNGWNSTIIASFVHEEGTLADLWVTPFALGDAPNSQLLTQNLNIALAGSFAWVININATDLFSTAKYILRFAGPGKSFDDIFTGTPNIPSPGFLVLQETTTSSPRSSTLSTSTASGNLLGLNPTSSLDTSSPITTADSSQSLPATTKSATLNLASFSTSLTALSPTITSASTSTSILTSTSTLTSIFTSKPTATSPAGLKIAAIVGIVISSIVGGVAIISLLILVIRRHRHDTFPASLTHKAEEDKYVVRNSQCPLGPSELFVEFSREYTTELQASTNHSIELSDECSGPSRVIQELSAEFSHAHLTRSERFELSA